jgi:hypothetical protein
MRAALDAAPNQPVPPHLARAFQMRGARVAATECTDRAPQALLVACIAEVVSTLRIRRDSGVIPYRAIGRVGNRSASVPSSWPRPSLGGIDPSEPLSEAGRTYVRKVLFHSRRPVKNDRVTFVETFSWFQHQKLTSLCGHCILVDRGIWYQSGREKLPWNADLRPRPALNGR